MKKVFMSVAIVAMMFAAVACGNKCSKKAAEGEAAATECCETKCEECKEACEKAADAVEEAAEAVQEAAETVQEAAK